MWSRDFFLEIISGVQLLTIEMSTFTPAIKLTFGHNRFGRRAVCNLQTRIQFSEKVT